MADNGSLVTWIYCWELGEGLGVEEKWERRSWFGGHLDRVWCAKAWMYWVNGDVSWLILIIVES